MKTEKIGVVGAGIMGSGIAQTFAVAGFDVCMQDVNQSALDRSLQSIEQSLERLARKGRIEDGEKSAALERISLETDIAGLANRQLIVEAATENTDIKLGIFQALDAACAPEAILASNTSSISLTRIAAATKRPERVVGMHFFNPVPMMALVEVIAARQTDPAVAAEVTDVARQIGKTPVAVNDSFGFVSNRILMPMINEAIFVLSENVASAEDIDQAMKLGMNHPMGPLALADLIGLDTCLSIMNVLHEGFGDPKYRPSPLLRQMVDAGYLGRKSGRGFYDYTG
ncbi:3-hydroxybutyryl-CoA dehydrogenase [Natronocella acetinitrilica]|uniref:3-hydroxybutyryl-CoA dehydrogenase n=1 Tax=Natronocella acetinitrilica TaxID=414046 RepID=A0AAE3KCH2_9GAMM|nr:3-hydroxybutyryl-CoA dehydrogenase [Natronocella acetinitrilica]MCP1675771.1 3-hydroxybutyryl-CoA dehydrogenase [Natronocella acetinitrilica]